LHSDEGSRRAVSPTTVFTDETYFVGEVGQSDFSLAAGLVPAPSAAVSASTSFVQIEAGAWLIWQGALWLWTPASYIRREPLPPAQTVDVLTPRPIVARGFAPAGSVLMICLVSCLSHYVTFEVA
jgi:hypothetical protein